ncbi:19780_t:CDS:1, partial [Gigaspora rosea]
KYTRTTPIKKNKYNDLYIDSNDEITPAKRKSQLEKTAANSYYSIERKETLVISKKKRNDSTRLQQQNHT